MRTLLIALLLTISFNANAAMWNLINQEYSPGNGFICTYQLQGTNYTWTILQRSSCNSYIFN